jgi:hypothetical protein
MGLVLDHLTARQSSEAHHFLSHVQVAAVVDTDLSDDERGVVMSDFAASDFHG